MVPFPGALGGLPLRLDDLATVLTVPPCSDFRVVDVHVRPLFLGSVRHQANPPCRDRPVCVIRAPFRLIANSPCG